MNRISTGRKGELIARKHLEAAGFEILATNWRGENAEIDIITQKDNELVFVEVRAKSTREFGSPAESITRRKRQKLIGAAECYLAQHQVETDWRIDFIGIEFFDGTHRLEHIPYAVTLDDLV
ncbi:MAG: YraN family protein [Dehalococcoidia bacterium]|nr:MAG: YraN family protein [Dehalococcoidia bacterium]